MGGSACISPHQGTKDLYFISSLEYLSCYLVQVSLKKTTFIKTIFFVTLNNQVLVRESRFSYSAITSVHKVVIKGSKQKVGNIDPNHIFQL